MHKSFQNCSILKSQKHCKVYTTKYDSKPQPDAQPDKRQWRCKGCKIDLRTHACTCATKELVTTDSHLMCCVQ